MNLRQLKYLVAVIDAGNMTRASETLNVAQTALSAQIKLLEEDLGIPLLTRHSRGIEPTAAGKLLRERGLAIFRMVDEARRDAQQLASAGHERVRFGITPALMLVVGTDLIERVGQDCPQVSLGLIEAMSHVLLPDLQSGALDFALCYDLPDHPHLRRAAILQEDLVFVSRPGPAPGQPIGLAEVLGQTLAMPEEPDTLRLAIGAAARDIGADLRVTHEVRSISAMKTLAVRGTASCVLPLAAVADEVAAGMLAARPITMPAVRRTLYLASPAHRPALRCDDAVSSAVRASLGRLVALLGPLAHPL